MSYLIVRKWVPKPDVPAYAQTGYYHAVSGLKGYFDWVREKDMATRFDTKEQAQEIINNWSEQLTPLDIAFESVPYELEEISDDGNQEN